MRTLPPLAVLTAGCALLGAWLGPAASAAAQQQAPTCAVESVGLVACIAGKLCACRPAPASAATRLPEGFRWDCGILRPACGGEVPATLDAYRGPLPEALGIERTNNVLTTVTGKDNQTQTAVGGGRNVGERP
jgi:hypothetical protein